MGVLTITIPGLPPRECSPNARVHWIVKAQHAGRYRQIVKLVAKSALAEHRKAIIARSTWVMDCTNKPMRLDITFVVPDRRRRDKTNFASAFKAGLDGLVDAGIIKDDSYECCDDQYHVVYEKGVSKTIVEVESA